MSEKLSPYEFAQLLVDISSKDRTISGEIFVKPSFEFATYDVSTEGRILFNKGSEADTIVVSPKESILRNDWPFGDTNE